MSAYKRPMKLNDLNQKTTPAKRTESQAEPGDKATLPSVSPETARAYERADEAIEETTDSHKITKIEVQKRRKNRFNIYIDDQFVAGISERTLTKLMLVKGQVVTDDEIKNIKATEEHSQLIETSLSYLSSMPRTVHEVRTKLQTVTDSESAIDDVMTYLASLGYIDDASYAKHYLNDAIHLKQKSPKRVQYELHQKGISDRIIEDTLAGYAEADAVNNAHELAAKKYHQYLRRTSSHESMQKTYAFLAQKGFNGDVISQALEPLKEQAIDEENERQNLRRDRDKYYRRYQKYQDGMYRTKQQLMKKGYMRELINEAMAELEE